MSPEKHENAKIRKRAPGEDKEARKAKYMRKIHDDDKATKAASFKKRMPTVINKASQLETLCGVPVCVVCYDAEGNINTWPRDKAEAKARVFGYKEEEVGKGTKREFNTIAMLEASKRNLVRKMAKEVAASLSDFADPSSLDAALKRVEERMNGLKKSGEREATHVEIGTTTTTSSSSMGNGFVDNDGLYLGDLDDDLYLDLGNIDLPNCNDAVQEFTSSSSLLLSDNDTNVVVPYHNWNTVGYFGPISTGELSVVLPGRHSLDPDGLYSGIGQVNYSSLIPSSSNSVFGNQGYTTTNNSSPLLVSDNDVPPGDCEYFSWDLAVGFSGDFSHDQGGSSDDFSHCQGGSDFYGGFHQEDTTSAVESQALPIDLLTMCPGVVQF